MNRNSIQRRFRFLSGRVDKLFLGRREREPVMHITTKGGWYADPEKLMRSKRAQDLIKRATQVSGHGLTRRKRTQGLTEKENAS